MPANPCEDCNGCQCCGTEPDAPKPPPATPKTIEFSLLSWNVYVRNDPDRVRKSLRGLAASHSPAVIGLQEAFRVRGHLNILPAFKRIWPRKPREARNNPFLVNGHVFATRNDWRMKMKLGWRFKKKKPPRIFNVARLKHRDTGQKVVLVNVHFPTGGPTGRNAKAWREGANRLVRIANNRKVPVLLVGDFNGTKHEVDNWIAQRANGHVVSDAKVDHMITVGTKDRWTRATVKRDGRHGSDHLALIYSVEIGPRS